MDAEPRNAGTEAHVTEQPVANRRRIVRATGGGLVAVLAAAVLSACGGDVTEDELEGDD